MEAARAGLRRDTGGVALAPPRRPPRLGALWQPARLVGVVEALATARSRHRPPEAMGTRTSRPPLPCRPSAEDPVTLTLSPTLGARPPASLSERDGRATASLLVETDVAWPQRPADTRET